MSRELEFDGWWEGRAVYSCDCCHKTESFRFDSEDIDSKAHRKELREKKDHDAGKRPVEGFLLRGLPEPLYQKSDDLIGGTENVCK